MGNLWQGMLQIYFSLCFITENPAGLMWHTNFISSGKFIHLFFSPSHHLIICFYSKSVTRPPNPNDSAAAAIAASIAAANNDDAASEGETEFTFRYRRSTEQGWKGGEVKPKLFQ